MKDRDAAVTWFIERGFFARKRDWALGETLLVSTRIRPLGEVQILENLLYLVPEANQWIVVAGQVPSSPMTLAEACHLAHELLERKGHE